MLHGVSYVYNTGKGEKLVPSPSCARERERGNLSCDDDERQKIKY